jgi:hypothetical protein
MEFSAKNVRRLALGASVLSVLINASTASGADIPRPITKAPPLPHVTN